MLALRRYATRLPRESSDYWQGQECLRVSRHVATPGFGAEHAQRQRRSDTRTAGTTHRHKL